MTNPVNSDDFLTYAAQKRRDFDARPAVRADSDRSEQAGAKTAGLADLARGRQRLAQQAHGETPIRGSEQARERVDALRAQLAAQPVAALRAHGRVDIHVVEAAMARPTA